MSTEETLLQRCDAKCELCASDSSLKIFDVPDANKANTDNKIVICTMCREHIENPTDGNANHWRCLKDSMWTPLPAVQVMAWRLLKELPTETWAQDLLEMLYLDEETLQWAEAALDDKSDADTTSTLDSNGNILNAGDSVTLIKDLDVKGANFTAKRGTTVKNISLTSNSEQIEGRVNDVRIVLLTCFLKKVG